MRIIIILIKVYSAFELVFSSYSKTLSFASFYNFIITFVQPSNPFTKPTPDFAHCALSVHASTLAYD